MAAEGRPSPSPGKRLLFGAVLVAGIWAFAELGATASFWILDGEPFSFSRLRAEQHRAASDEVEAVDADIAPRVTPAAAQALHPYVGYVFDPDHAARSAFPEPGLPSTVSSWGFVDDAPPLRERSDDRLVVGVLGGSLARFFARKMRAVLAERLSAAGPFAGRQVEIVTLAIDGHKQPQQLLTVTWLLALGARFDVLINLDGFNEVALHEAENGRHGVSPSYPRAWYTRAGEVPDPATLAAMGEITFARARRAERARALLASPLRLSVLANLVWRTSDRRLAAAQAAANEMLYAQPTGAARFAVRGPPYEAASRDALYADLAAIWRESSIQLDRLARANGIQYFHFLQPNQYVEGSKTMGAAERETAFVPDHKYRPGVVAGYPHLQREGAVLRERGVRFADLTGVFQEEQGPIYVDACCHVNDRGYRILARAIADSVLAEARPPGTP